LAGLYSNQHNLQTDVTCSPALLKIQQLFVSLRNNTPLLPQIPISW